MERLTVDGERVSWPELFSMGTFFLSQSIRANRHTQLFIAFLNTEQVSALFSTGKRRSLPFTDQVENSAETIGLNKFSAQAGRKLKTKQKKRYAFLWQRFR